MFNEYYFEIPFLLLFIPLFGVMWQNVHKAINSRFANIQISHNITNFIHALSVVLFTSIATSRSHYLSFIVSSSAFFAYDIWMIGKMRNLDKFRIWANPMVIHHLMCIHGLWNVYIGEHREALLFIFGTLEGSNLLLYISYYFIKKHPEYTNTRLLLLYSQFLAYGYLRLWKFPVQILAVYYDELITTSYLQQTKIVLLYILGLVWTTSLGRKLIGHIKEDLNKKIEV